MQKTSEAYKLDMGSVYRGRSHVWVHIGLVNLDAQDSAHITSSKSGSEAHLYDGSSASSVTSTENDGHITFAFTGTENNIAGLTLALLSNTTTITVTNGSKTGTYVVGQGNIMEIDDGYENCSYLTLTPNSGKLSLSSIMFGLGLSFNDASIMNTNRINSVSHISNELPRKQFTFTLNNRAHMFNQDNPYGYAPYLQEKQVIDFTYGRELENGTTYKIKGGKVRLQTWSSDDYEAKFTCVGLLDYLTDEYKKGRYYPNGISAYDLAEDVLEDAGVEDYILDDSLKSIKFKNPLPICKHKEALQAIANASMSILYEDRDGNICIGSAQKPSFLGDVSFLRATDYSSVASIFDTSNSDNYADFEYNYIKADGVRKFFPEKDSYLSIGYVNDSLNTSGVNPTIDIKFAEAFQFNMMYLYFGFDNVTSLTFTPYLNEMPMPPTDYTNVGTGLAISYSGMVDRVTISFMDWTANTRVHLNSIEIEGSPDYTLTRRDLKNPAVATSLERITKVNVNYYEYSVGESSASSYSAKMATFNQYENSDNGLTMDISTSESVYGGAVTINAVKGDNEVRFGTPMYDLTVTAGTIKEQGAYYAVISSDKEQSITVNGKVLSNTKNVHSINIHEKGTEKTCDNPLIGDLDTAKKIATWLRDFYDDDLEYTFNYRGDPALDADDVILLENQFVHRNEIRIVEESINTSVGMDFSCAIKARRTFFQVDADVHRAIVGKALVGERIG